MFRILSIGVRDYFEKITDPEIPTAAEHVECEVTGARLGMLSLSRLAIHNPDLQDGLIAVEAESMIAAMHVIILEQRHFDSRPALLNRRRDIAQDYPAIDQNLLATFSTIIQERPASLMEDMSVYHIEDQAVDVEAGVELAVLTFDEIARSTRV